MRQTTTETWRLTHPNSLPLFSASSRQGFVLLLIGVMLFALISYGASYRFYLDLETDKAESASEFSASTLRHIMWQHQPLLYAISIDQRAINATYGQDVDQVNPWLASLTEKADLESVYLMNAQGRTVAASNYSEPVNFIGESYSFRPYFQDAMQGEMGSFFAIGVTTGTPGYFIALPILDSEQNKITGVVAAKVSVSQFDPLWKGELSSGFISNEDGVIILSSDARWLYHSTTQLTDQQLSLIRLKRQFANQSIPPLNWQLNGEFAWLSKQELIHSIRPIQQTGWQVHHFRPTSIARQQATLVAVIISSLLLVLLVWAMAVRAKRTRLQLHASELNRGELKAINHQLEQEVRERKQAEVDLAKAQARLIQSSRMAALGQLSASVIHELGQPLSTFRNYLAAAEFSKAGEADPKLFVQLSKVAQRMQNTTDELRAFARPDRYETEQVDLNQVVQNAIRMTDDKLKSLNIQVDTHLISDHALLEGRTLRLEQIVINLITNACNALIETPSPKINICIQNQGDDWLLSVSDNGLGFGGQSPEQLFEAFYTTGTRGNSLGLGLAICTAIVSEHHGSIWAQENPQGGAIFYVRLPKTYNEND